VLKAEGAREAATLRADVLPEFARGEANTVFVIPSEFTQALADIGQSLAGCSEGSRTNGSAAPAMAALTASGGDEQSNA
jgi:hypothetical protein